jgi:hypothetical protein
MFDRLPMLFVLAAAAPALNSVATNSAAYWDFPEVWPCAEALCVA